MLVEALEHYNELHAVMGLVLFEEATQHVYDHNSWTQTYMNDTGCDPRSRLTVGCAFMHADVESAASSRLPTVMPCWWGLAAVGSKVSVGWLPFSACWKSSRSRYVKATASATSK